MWNSVKIAFLAAIGALLAENTPASAAPIFWTQWNTFSAGDPGGSASGTVPGVTVTYGGEIQNLLFNYPSWGPAGTFDGGTVGNAPPSPGGIIRLFGGGNTIDTITFSSAVTNPILAIWSLGQGGINPTFDFTATPTFESGGPSNEFGGSAISVVGNSVLGVEGNGTVQFTGTYTSISWNNPTFENWYGFTVGITDTVPEPETWAMMIAGIGLIWFAVRRRPAAKDQLLNRLNGIFRLSNAADHKLAAVPFV
jgi:PEP-CTERM motif